MNHKSQVLMIGLIGFALLATSCRRLPFAPPTTIPTITPTPRSTPLPPVATAIPLGSADNPLHMKIVAPASSDATPEVGTQEPFATTVSDLAKALHDDTQLTIQVETVASDAEALAALCDSPRGTVSVAWLSGIAYAAAYAQGCGSALLEVERGVGASASPGDQARIIVNAALGLSGVGDLAAHTFCRLGYANAESWLIPSLMLQSSGVAISDLKAVRDYDDASAMIDDVAAGTCDAAGISASEYDLIANADARAKIRTLQQSVTIPYAVLVVPEAVPLGQQEALSSALISIGNGSRASILKPLLNQDQIAAATDTELGTLRSFISRAGLDLAQVGS